MGTNTAKVAEDLSVIAASFFQGISEDGEPLRFKMARGQLPVVVGSLGQGEDGVDTQGEVEGDEAERQRTNVFA